MDKRLLNFMLVSMLLFIGYMELLKLTRPPVEEGDAIVAEQQDNIERPAGPENETEAQTTAESQPQEFDSGTPEGVAGETKRPSALERFTIGSVDPADGYSMLVTLVNQGAAVERIELSHPRYSNLEDSSAYIGHLAWRTVDEGVEVTVVGRGTPAAKAGVRVGDIITEIGDDAVGTPESAATALRKFKYGSEVAIKVLRDGSSVSLTLASTRRPQEVVRPELLPEGTGQFQQLSYLLTLHQLGHKKARFDEDEIANGSPPFAI